MKQNNFGRFLLVIAIILWSLYMVYPPTSRDLLQEFSRRAVNKDATFAGITNQAIALQNAGTNNEFVALQLATGTNELQKYFPFYPAQNQVRPNQFILNRLQRDAAGRIKLGLDLQGGTSFLVEMDTTKLESVEIKTNAAGQTVSVTNRTDVTSALSQAIEVLRKRIDRFGVAEPIIQSAGGNRILIQLPGLSQADKDSAKQQIQKTAYLEFRMVHDNSDEIIHNGDPVPLGYELLKHLEQLPNNQSRLDQAIVMKKAANGLAGDIVKDAYVSRGNLGELQIDFRLTDDAAKRFGEVTRNNVGHRMAIVLDGELYSAPNINTPIETGSGMISGSYTDASARELANVLQNPLKAPLKIVYASDVDPTLGKDSIKSGIQASLWGVIFVAGFMLIYYRLAGLTANIALITNIIILLGVMCSIGTTFTLPGIAGVVLTIGMAVDANVLIYERIREELAKGKTLRGAIEAGYARAFGTIFDSHVTTLISSVILIYMGTGEIKGFGVTLTIGVAASLFTALVVTRLIFNFLLERNLMKSLSMAHIITASKVDFMGMAKPLFIVTWLFVVGSLGFGITRGEKLFGVDFLGGDSTTFSFVQKQDPDKIRKVLEGIGEKDAQIQFQRDTGAGTETLRLTTSSGTVDKVQAALAQGLPAAQFKLLSSQQVGATLGKEIQQSAIVASLLAMFGILVYVAFRYEFSFAVAAVIAVLHDVLFAIGAYCIANAVSGRQFNATVLAAILTIIGFSINDKIVIFDRIREDLKLGLRGTFREIINQALNQTLSRTIITSGTVFLATLSLFIFGGGVINDFAFTFLIGILVGTYSSIYIASVIVLWWHKGERPNIGASQVAVQNAPAAKR
jgi:SecD/SecF fusion protein